jgi:hypothetical protein
MIVGKQKSLDEIEEMHGDVPKAAVEAVSEMRLKGSTVAIFEGARMLAESAADWPGAFAQAAAEAAAKRLPPAKR